MEHIDDSTSVHINEEKIMQSILQRIQEVKSYTPRVGIFGSTGVGKSSLCNSLFGRHIAEVSDVAACTREIQEINIPSGDGHEGGLTIIDFPGVGETIERDKEYIDLYKKNLEKLDLVVWVIKSDERSYAISQKVYNEILLPNIGKCPVLFVINQIDKIEPMLDEKNFPLWDNTENAPKGKQLASINKKIIEVSSAFNISVTHIIATSVARQYNISEMMEKIIDILPKEKKYAFYREAGEEIKTDKMAESAEKGVWDTVKEWTGEAWDSVKDIAVEAMATAVTNVGKKLWSKIKSWK